MQGLGCFTKKEAAVLNAARGKVDPDSATIVYGVYENPFAKSGGIFAVADNYASALIHAGRDVVVLTPYHDNLKTTASSGDVEKIGECFVPFGAEPVSVELYEYNRNGVRWILMRAEGLFDAEGGASKTDPYIHEDPTKLLLDSLFASAAIPPALVALGLTENLMIHVQDWELAATALTVKLSLLKNALKSAAVVLTSHNPYDHGLPSGLLRLITHRKFPAEPPLETVYQHMIPLTDAPLTTVSQTFARELTTDPLHTVHFAGHLQGVFKSQGVVGVDNGLFGKPQQVYSEKALKDARAGKPAKILGEKLQQRKTMFDVLSSYQPEGAWGTLNGGKKKPLSELPDDVPVFLMFGRLDPGQKGFDVLSRSIEAMPRGQAKFILTPIVGGAPQSFVEDLKKLAETCAGDVVIYPFRMEQGYMETMAGVTYAVMPSLYEPFGGATEPYLQGTPVVARATGGLVQQVVDLKQDPQNGTGILYREPPPEFPHEWSRLETASTPEDRLSVSVYREMVSALALALTRAGDVYRTDSISYGRMLSNLADKALTFSWERTVKEYSDIYQQAVK